MVNPAFRTFSVLFCVALLTACTVMDGGNSTLNVGNGATGSTPAPGAGDVRVTATALQDLVSPGSRWGGRGIVLVINPGGGIMRSSCAQGSLLQTLTLDQNNRFEVSGIFVSDTDHHAHPAQFIGRIDPNSLVLALSVLLTDRFKNQTIGAWDLVYGQAASAGPCLRGNEKFPAAVHPYFP